MNLSTVSGDSDAASWSNLFNNSTGNDVEESNSFQEGSFSQMCELACTIEKEPSTYLRMDDDDLMVVDSDATEGCIRRRFA